MKGYSLHCILLAGLCLPSFVMAETESLTDKILSRTVLSAKSIGAAAIIELDKLEAAIAENVIYQVKLAEHVRTAKELSPNKTILPEEFKVYYKAGLGISRKSFKTGQEKTIPNKNNFTAAPGCYVACYSSQAKNGVLVTDDKYHLVGQVRFEGRYTNGICVPKGYEQKDIRAAKELKVKCEESFPDKCEKRSCQVHGLTSQWFN